MEYQKKNILMTEKDGTSHSEYCIVLVNDEGLPVWFTGYEAYVNDKMHKAHKEATSKKMMGAVVGFLNFLIGICLIKEVTITVISNYLETIKYKDDGSEVTKEYWEDQRKAIFDFLITINDYKPGYFENLDCSDLRKYVVATDGYGKKEVRSKYSCLGVIPPTKKKRKKFRVIPFQFVKTLIEEAEKYDPEIALGIALQSYAGLREGEVVNIAVRDIRVKYNIGMIYGINIDITKHKSWNIHRTSKKARGKIKKPRTQSVYDSFLQDVDDLFKEHMRYHEIRQEGTDLDLTGMDTPLFIDKNGNPMSVDIYTDRIRDLFIDHFLPRLITDCMESGTYDDNAVYIEEYQKSFTGCHALRHTYTMYLKERLEAGEVAWRRGDESVTSQDTYQHESQKGNELFDKGTHDFQRRILKGNKLI